jgi:carboxyl-terminal processing protease
MIRLLCGVLLSALLALALTPEQRDNNIKSFEYVWTTVRDKHWDPKLGGLNWQAVHDELRPAIEKAESMEQARTVMSDMLGRLHQTHFGIIPAELYSEVDANKEPSGDQGANKQSHSDQGSIGFDVRVVGSQVLVTSVEPGTPADKAGVRPGWELRKIGTQDIPAVIARLDQKFKDSSLRQIIERRTVMSRLEADANKDISVEFVDGGNRPVTRTVKHAAPRGELTRFGYLWPSYVWIETGRVKTSESAIGYARFNMFLDPPRLMGAFADAVQSCMPCDGFIVDLRGNPGGLGVMAMGMAGWFIDTPGQRLGTLYLRENNLNFVVNPRVSVFTGPVAILVDGASASTSEIFAGGLKDLKRARIFGTRTAAAALPSIIEKLPNGDGFQYAIANYLSEGGKPLEGQGVTPDVEAPPTREALLRGKDPAQDAAVHWIESQRKHP